MTRKSKQQSTVLLTETTILQILITAPRTEGLAPNKRRRIVSARASKVPIDCPTAKMATRFRAKQRRFTLELTLTIPTFQMTLSKEVQQCRCRKRMAHKFWLSWDMISRSTMMARRSQRTPDRLRSSRSIILTSLRLRRALIRLEARAGIERLLPLLQRKPGEKKASHLYIRKRVLKSAIHSWVNLLIKATESHRGRLIPSNRKARRNRPMMEAPLSELHRNRGINLDHLTPINHMAPASALGHRICLQNQEIPTWI